MKLSIIIPTYNESKTIGKTLSFLLNNVENLYDTEIIVVDGGSEDTTLKIVDTYKGVKIVHSEKGRGKQMNTAVNATEGSVLYFLHADSFPPKKFDQLILQQINNNNLAGCFKMKFDRSHWWLYLAGWFTQFNLKFFRGGDQSLFITKELFSKQGGFVDTYSIFEDHDFIRRLYKINEFTVIQKPIITSSRRYTDNGIARLQFFYWSLYIKKWLGASNTQLEEYYKRNIR